MEKVCYRPLIDEMVWSYSRISCFDDCPYKWFLKYIKNLKEEPQFYASYGSFLHKLIEKIYNNELSAEQAGFEFLLDFQASVKGNRPQESTVKKYISSGIDYFRNFKPFPFNKIAVEKKIDFKIGENKFTGYIDYLGEKNGKYYIIDNKSRDLSPRSTRKTPTKKDEELDTMLRQLYIYAVAIKQEYGVFPEKLCFNCFKSQTFIEEPFNKNTYYETIDWATAKIDEIKNTELFPPNREFFKCSNICGLNEKCYCWQTR